MIRGVILPLTCIETSNLQVKFCSRIAFYNWCFQHYHYFKICLMRISNKKFWWNEIVSSTTRNFVINDQFHLNFLGPGSHIFEYFLGLQEKHLRKKIFFFEISKERYLLLGGCADIIFGLLCETLKCTLVKIKQTLWKFKI